jgi:hypothetical protein
MRETRRDRWAAIPNGRLPVLLEEADEEQGGHAFRVMNAYARSFESEGKPAESYRRARARPHWRAGNRWLGEPIWRGEG